MKNMTEKTFYIMVGTKGQLIKMAPIMLEMDKRGIEYNYINAAQHTTILDEISGLFGLKKPDLVLDSVGKDITNIKEMLWWMSKNILKFGILKPSVFKKSGAKNILIVHGDAPPALLGAIIGKLNKFEIAHVESGERTYNKFEPFPEEIIRIIVDKVSTYLFACSDNAYSNLITEGVRGNIYNVKLNTGFDATKIAISTKKNIHIPSDEYVLVSIHRFETISSKKRMKTILDIVNKISKNMLIVFPLHESTKSKLESFGYLSSVEQNENIQIMPLQDYFTFINLIKHSLYIVTDGGGPQQESYYLGIPCLLLREHTERNEYPNVYLAGFDEEKISLFINNYSDYKIKCSEISGCRSSKNIVSILVNII
jgi:UDP-N-acetylglucosamine 2-epimerase (non-hydrolysing)